MGDILMNRISSWGDYDLRVRSSQEGAVFWCRMGPCFASRELDRELGDRMYDTAEHHWLLAEQTETGRLVGFTSWHTAQLGRGIVWLDWSWVDPAHRRRGLYAHLFERRLQLVAPLDARVLRGATANATVARLFRRHGFAEYRQRGRWRYYEREQAAE